ncbi:MAG: hypothetical protein PHG63_01765 [Candidatus Dojkabacteria bacterium]|nr:hypothetical protein [Candidatus Dojkabacteria bacterium]
MGNLFISKVRVKLLKLFFLDISKEIHIRGIVRTIDEEINAVRRELKNLERASVLVSEKRGNRQYYMLNRKCPIFPELLGIVHKESGLGSAILNNIDRMGTVLYALLTTAYIENHHPSQYDIDVLIIGELNLKAVSSVIHEVEESSKTEIRYSVMSEEEFTFRKKKRDAFILNILNKHKIMLVGDENRLLA